MAAFMETVFCLVSVLTKKQSNIKQNLFFSNYKNNSCLYKISVTQIHNGGMKIPHSPPLEGNRDCQFAVYSFIIYYYVFF